MGVNGERQILKKDIQGNCYFEGQIFYIISKILNSSYNLNYFKLLHFSKFYKIYFN